MKPTTPAKGTPEFTAQTRANIKRALGPEFLKIHHAIQFSDDLLDNDDRSRVKAVDPNGLLLMAIRSNIGPAKSQWSQDSGKNHNKNGIVVRGSYRSRTTPSVQVCVIEARGGQYSEVLAIDVDKHNPFENFPGHTAEVLENKIKRKPTDPKVIARMLDKAI